ncbi:MAG TPA: hypothetical protein VKT70_09400, partial [Stellaceae bacterium]|nr:hypothetical protein [Stellaceae bacterium]
MAHTLRRDAQLEYLDVATPDGRYHVPAWRHPDRLTWRMWCGGCHRYHAHGRGRIDGTDAGHRVAHCHTESRYRGRGYILVDSGAMPPDLLADARRAHPRGPRAVLGAAAIDAILEALGDG